MQIPSSQHVTNGVLYIPWGILDNIVFEGAIIDIKFSEDASVKKRD